MFASSGVNGVSYSSFHSLSKYYLFDGIGWRVSRFTAHGLCRLLVVQQLVVVVQLDKQFIEPKFSLRFKDYLDQTNQLQTSNATNQHKARLHNAVCAPHQLQGRLKIDFAPPPSFEAIGHANPAMEQDRAAGFERGIDRASLILALFAPTTIDRSNPIMNRPFINRASANCQTDIE